MGSSRRKATVWLGALSVAAVGASFGLLTLAEARSAPGSSFGGNSWVGAIAELGAGWALIAAGTIEAIRRPTSQEGWLLSIAGIGWFFAEWNNAGLESPAAFTFGLIVYALAAPLVAHAALAYPTGRLSSRVDRTIVLVAYAGAGLVLGLIPALFFDPALQGCALCPANLVQVGSELALVNGFSQAGLFLGVGWVATLLVIGARRLANVQPPLRRLLWPVLAPAGCYLVLVGMGFAHSLARGTLGDDPFEYRLWLGEAAFLALIALGVSWTWIRNRRTRSAVVQLVMDAAQSPPPGGLRDVLASVLGDSSLELAYAVGDPPRHVRADGQATSSARDRDEAVTPLVRGDRTVAILRHRAGLMDDPGLVQEVAAAARLGMENERLHAEVLSHIDDLRTAQVRIVADGDAERRRLERDLHDGAQQRLVGLSLALRLIRPQSRLPRARRLTTLIDKADGELRLAIDELRDLAQGIYPAVLTDEGLAAAVETLADTSPIPVVIAALPPERLPAPVETAVYFLIAESSALLGAVTGAEGATVAAKHDANRLTVRIVADAVAGSGPPLRTALTDVADRIGALGGRLQVEQAPGGPLTIQAEIPCES